MQPVVPSPSYKTARGTNDYLWCEKSFGRKILGARCPPVALHAQRAGKTCAGAIGMGQAMCGCAWRKEQRSNPCRDMSVRGPSARNQPVATSGTTSWLPQAGNMTHPDIVFRPYWRVSRISLAATCRVWMPQPWARSRSKLSRLRVWNTPLMRTSRSAGSSMRSWVSL